MISRTWHGIVPLEHKQRFKDYLNKTGVSDTMAMQGNRGAYVKIVEQNEWAHFFLCTIWETMDSVVEYAGSNPEIAVTYLKDEQYGLISDPIVIHQEVSSSQNPFI